MTNIFETIQETSDFIRNDLNKNENNKQKIILVYAFNGTGKTQISASFDNKENQYEDSGGYIKSLNYSAFFEDVFSWDNENRVLKCLDSDLVLSLIAEQGLENKITDYFQKLTKSKIFPTYDLKGGEITFSFSPGDDRQQENIKISRGEESLFVSSVFYTLLSEAISVLSTKVDDRETDKFNKLEYIVIDDPVSSIDDTKIITTAIELIKIIRTSTNAHKLKFLITTHHALFFNIIYREFYNDNQKQFRLIPYILSKNNNEYSLLEQSESPFAYHLNLLTQIKNALEDDSIQKYHFNLMRGLLEKNAHFLGYKHWDDCVEESEDKKEFVKWINHYSHSRLSDLESGILSESEKQMFEKFFNEFVKKFNYQIQINEK